MTSFMAHMAELPNLSLLVRRSRRRAAQMPGGVARQAMWAEMLVHTYEADISPRAVDLLVQLATRAHNMWHGHRLPEGDGQLTDTEWTTIGWAATRYGALSARELTALVQAGAPFREDTTTPPEVVRFLKQATHGA